MTAVWRLMPGLQLRYRSWDQDEFVLYNSLSGDTHLLDAACIEILTVLQAGEHSQDALAAALQLTPDMHADLTALLHELRGMALADARPC